MTFVKRNGYRLLLAIAVVSVAAFGCSQPSKNPERTQLGGAEGGALSDFIPGPPQSRLISQGQYNRVIHDVFGSDIQTSVRFPPLRREGGLLALATADTALTPAGFESFYSAATEVANQVMDSEHRNIFVPCKPISVAAPDAACAKAFFESIGPQLYRRPLTDAESEFLVHAAADAATATNDFYRGLSLSLTGMLISPKFLMITDLVTTDRNGRARLDPYSRAARLSLFLWNSYPDRELLRAAGSKQLETREQIRVQVKRMMSSPRIEVGVRAFFEDMLNLDGVESVTKDSTVYPMFSRRVAVAAKEQVLRTIVDHVLVKNDDYRQLFTTQALFMTPILGPIYEQPVTGSEDWHVVDSADVSRLGLLTQPAFLAHYAHEARSSPTRRGRAVREVFLCQKVPNAPPNVDFTALDNPDPNLKTARERLQFHQQNPVCAGCHKITDPIGLAMEKFDGAGRHRETEGGATIDTSGSLDGKPFKDLAEFGQRLAEHPAVTHCLATRMVEYAVTRHQGANQKSWLDELERRFAASQYRVLNLMEEIAASDEFFSISTPPAVDTDTLAATAATESEQRRSDDGVRNQ